MISFVNCELIFCLKSIVRENLKERIKAQILISNIVYSIQLCNHVLISNQFLYAYTYLAIK